MALRRGIAIAAALGVLALFAYLYRPGPPAPTPTVMQATTTTLRIGTTTIVAEVAQSGEDRARGLGGRTSLAEGRGMWFVFEQDGEWGFWMKDTLIALDMVWVAADGTIVTIAHNVAPESYPQVYKPSGAARYVLELPGGFAQKHGIAEGQEVVVQ